MKLKNRVTALGVSLVLAVGGTAGVAHAASVTDNVSGQLNTAGLLVQYDHTRTHHFHGPITLNVTDMPYGYLRLGLRNMNAPGYPQFTDTRQWNKKGTQRWINILKNTRFSFQGRMKPGAGRDNWWGGRVTY